MITGATRVAGVIGDPVPHSLSPRLHNAAYTALRKRGASEQFVDSERLESLADDAPNPDELRERAANAETVRAAIARLPGESKEGIVLGAMEGFSASCRASACCASRSHASATLSIMVLSSATASP
mgnify:CR=1 FL=1